MNTSDVSKMVRLLRTTSSISNLEMPALLVAVLALIPGVFDEAFVGVTAVVLFAIIACGRRYLINHRNEFQLNLEKAFRDNKITVDEYNTAIRDLNILTIEGGK